MKPEILPQRAAARRQKNKKKKRKGRFGRFVLRLFIVFLLAGIGGGAWLFLTPSGKDMRYLAADTLITTQHRHWAKYFIGEAEAQKRVAEYSARFEQMGEEKDRHTIKLPLISTKLQQTPLVEVEEVSGRNYHGYVTIVHDPTKIRLGIPATVGRGERVSSMVERLGAVAGVNGGGFADPNWNGNGFKPIGVVISQGQLYYNDMGKNASAQIVGIDKQGKMIAGHYSLSELSKMNVQEAVTFQPRLIVNGKGLIRNASEGWGIAPRTAMGQRADGAIIFVTVDGRQPGYSIGANLYDMQNILLKHGAVIGANLDGGSSTVLVKDHAIVNKPSSEYGERYLPTAFLVFEHPETVSIPNIWAGLNPSDIDAAKKR